MLLLYTGISTYATIYQHNAGIITCLAAGKDWYLFLAHSPAAAQDKQDKTRQGPITAKKSTPLAESPGLFLGIL
jgi:hypothetical protein